MKGVKTIGLAVICLMVAVTSSCFGQITFQKTFGGTGNDLGLSIQQTTDGGYIISGGTYSFGAGNSDIYLIKTNSNGDTLWTKTYGGINDDGCRAICETTDGGYIIAGFTLSFGTGNQDVYLLKTEANGDTLWTKTYGGGNNDYGKSVQQTADGGYIITGTTQSFGAGITDEFLIKTPTNGNTLWTKTLGGIIIEDSYSVRQSTDEGYIIAGNTGLPGNYVVYLLKTDSIG